MLFPAVSVIIPVYNVELFAGQCAESLMCQSLTDVEYIFVDDASTDSSMEIIRTIIGRHPEREGHVRILRHESNRGLPAARNTGLAVAQGEYIFHCDSDDFVEPQMLERMVTKALETEADMVWCDWMLTFENNGRNMRQPAYDSPVAALRGMLRGAMKYNVWNKIVRRSLYDGISFPEGRSMGEDMTMIRVASRARKVAYCPGAFYHYRRTNAGALTQNYSAERLDELKENTLDTVNFLLDNWNHPDKEKEIAFFCLNVKLPFLFTGNGDNIRLWREWFPESDKYIMGNKIQSLRTRILQLCAARKWDWVIKAYYMIVYKTIYGVFYR